MKETALIVEVRKTIAPVDNHVQTCIPRTPEEMGGCLFNSSDP